MRSDSPVTFVFFHYGTVPFYLRCAIESARFFNPDARIILVCDSQPKLSPEWKVELYGLETFATPALAAFQKVYVHISTFRERYERFVLERWYLLDELRRQLGCGPTVALDSDLMVFQPFAPLFEQFGDKSFAMQRFSPHLTFIRSTMQGFLEHIMRRYTDPDYLDQARVRFHEARARGGLRNLGEMEFVAEYLQDERNDVNAYGTTLLQGHSDTNINVPDGCVSRKIRRRNRKCVFWEYTDGVYVPSLRDAQTHAKIPVVNLHFQGPAKKLIRRFNPVGAEPLLPFPLRCKYFEFVFNRFSAPPLQA
ncbi:MAG: hypothetical protein RLZZ244_3129 [Verrucomicrobiota bacterium]|jgi:hypothetical protein